MKKTLPFAAFGLAALALAAPVEPGPVVLRQAGSVDWKNSAALPLGAEYHLLREDPKTGGIQALVRFPKGYALPSHTHQHDESLIVVEGKLRVRSGGMEKVLGPGGYALVPAGAAHELKTEGWGKVLLVLTTAGPYGLDKTSPPQ